MDLHAHRRGARAARSHGAVEVEHGATAVEPRSRTADGKAGQPHHQAGPGTGTEARAGHRVPLSVALPVIAAVAFGCYTIFIDHASGATGGQAALLGLIAAVVSGTLGVLLVRQQSTLITEVRALAYGALFGSAMGWLYSLGGQTVLKSSTWGLIMGTAMFLVSLYLFRSHRIREPHGLHRPRRSHQPRHPHGPHQAAH